MIQVHYIIYNIWTVSYKKQKTRISCIQVWLFTLRGGRYNAHHLLLTSCIAENIIPNGLRPVLEGTIGNHDEEFKWQVIIIKQWQTYQLKSKT